MILAFSRPPGDPLTMISFLNSFFGRYGKHPQTGVTDAGYGPEENYRLMEESGIEANVKKDKIQLHLAYFCIFTRFYALRIEYPEKITKIRRPNS